MSAPYLSGSGTGRGRGPSRRGWLRLMGAAAGAALLPRRAFAAEATAGDAGAALADTNVFYVTPLHANGAESRCQSEVWFVAEPAGAYVVTAAGAWRARAVANGLTEARIWVGDVGVWSDSGGRYRDLPVMQAVASRIDDPAEHARVLELFGDKYSLEWLMWGPRFRDGLADGSRVMLQYRPH